METVKEFALEFFAIIVMVLVVAALGKIFEHFFKRKMGE